jgi:hypothetical protein
MRLQMRSDDWEALKAEREEEMDHRDTIDKPFLAVVIVAAILAVALGFAIYPH